MRRERVLETVGETSDCNDGGVGLCMRESPVNAVYAPGER